MRSKPANLNLLTRSAGTYLHSGAAINADEAPESPAPHGEAAAEESHESPAPHGEAAADVSVCVGCHCGSRIDICQNFPPSIPRANASEFSVDGDGPDQPSHAQCMSRPHLEVSHKYSTERKTTSCKAQHNIFRQW